MEKQNAFVLWFDELGIEDVPLVGGKNASLGEMYRNLVPKGVPIPNGFAVTAHAYRHLLRASGAMDRIKAIMEGLDTRDMDETRVRLHAATARELPESMRLAHPGQAETSFNAQPSAKLKRLRE